MYRCYDAVAKDVSLFSDLLRSSDQDTLIYTSDGQEYFSSTQDLPAELLETLQQKVAYVIAQRSVRILRNVGGNSVVIQGRLLQSRGEDFCVYRLTKTTQPAGLDKHAIRYLSADSDLPDCSPLEYYLGGSERILATQNACDRYAGMNGPVLIVGARGTGKDQMCIRDSLFTLRDAAHQTEVRLEHLQGVILQKRAVAPPEIGRAHV